MAETTYKLEWDKTGEKIYETGVNKCVLYPYNANAASGAHKYSPGVAWNGVTGITESPSGAEASPIYADNIKYLNLYSKEEYASTIEAYTYPDEFAECDGSAALSTSLPGVMLGQQSRKMFGLSYMTLVGNDEEDTDYGYKIHLVYGCKASPSEKQHATVNDSPDATSMSWEINTTPVNVPSTLGSFEPVSTITIDSTKFTNDDLTKLEALKGALWGTSTADPYLPTPEELAKLLA